MTGIIDKDYLTFFTLIFCLSIGVFHHAEVFQFSLNWKGNLLIVGLRACSIGIFFIKSVPVLRVNAEGDTCT